jgi:hypothetical protein
MQRRTLLLALAAAGPAAALTCARPAAAAPAEAILLRRWPGTPPALAALLSLAHGVPPAALAAWLAAPAGRAAWSAAAGPLAGRLHPAWTGPAPAADPAWFGPEVAAWLGTASAPACRAEAPCAPAPLTDAALQHHLAAGPAAAALADRLARHPDPAVRAAVAAARALCADAQAPLAPAGLAWL